MARKGRAPKREREADPLYNNELITRAINYVMWDGKKQLGEKIFYSALNIIEEKTQEDPVEVFETALKNAMPVLEVRSRRVGGSTYQVPVEVNPNRRVALGLRWIIQAARNRGERKMEDRLANEIIDAYRGEGTAVKKREDVHRMAEANKLFAHYRW